MRTIIDKNIFMKVQQCTKAGYLLYNHPELKSDNPFLETFYRRYLRVKELAKEIFPDGYLGTSGEHEKFENFVKFTDFLLIEANANLIYDACFQAGGKRCSVDFLVRGKKVWKIYDVKTSTSLDERHIIETAFKADTIKAKYPEVKIEAYLMYINKEYVLEKELNVEEFFITENVTSILRHVQPLVDRYSRLATKVFEMNAIPDTAIGTKCSTPFDCEFKKYCWKNVPENSVFEISRLWEIKKFQMYDQGIVKLEDIPRNVKLNEKQWMQIDCTVQNRQIIDPVAIGRFLEKIEYPISAMDFETCQPIIPIYQKTKPYQHTPIQFSVHRIDSENSDLLHYEFLHDGGMREVRINFMNRLMEAVGETGTVLVYNKKFEESRLKEIVKAYPIYKVEVDNIISRMVDLMEPFDHRYLYHPAQKGSASLKVVLPAWVPELSYKDLEIFGGASASEEFEKMSFLEMNKKDREKTRRALLEYCKMDTYALIRLLEVLRNSAGEGSGKMAA